MADISDEELFNNALESTEPEVAEQEPEQVAREGDDQRPRDEQGRFAPKQEGEPKAEAEPTAKAVEPAKDEAQVPSWRLKELREERDALRQQLADFQRQATQRPQAQPAPKPDLFEKPDEFVRAGVQEAVDPIKTEITQLREFYSEQNAVREHGQEKVQAARAALENGMKVGDAGAWAIYQQAMRSIDPYGQILRWHTSQEITANPDAYAQRWLEDKLSKDEKFKGELLAKLNPALAEKPKPVFKVPPNLSRAAAEQTALQEDGDLSNESLFASAMR